MSKLRKNTRIGKRIYFWFIEEPGILRGAYGNFMGYTHGGLAKCAFEFSSVCVETVPAAVEVHNPKDKITRNVAVCPACFLCFDPSKNY